MTGALAAIERPSPNHGERRGGKPIDMIVLHYTGMPSTAASLDRLCDPAAEVSAHYLIDEDGTVYRLVDESRRAWHAGRSSWQGTTDVNTRSIGIELQNPGHEFGYRPFPAAQIAALIALLSEIRGRQVVPRARVIGHSDVAPGRKADPGELFPWSRLAAAGHAQPLPRLPSVAPPLGAAGAVACLETIGYATGAPAYWTRDLRAALKAFQRRWRQDAVNGLLDFDTTRRLVAVAAVAASLDAARLGCDI